MSFLLARHFVVSWSEPSRRCYPCLLYTSVSVYARVSESGSAERWMNHTRSRQPQSCFVNNTLSGYELVEIRVAITLGVIEWNQSLWRAGLRPIRPTSPPDYQTSNVVLNRYTSLQTKHYRYAKLVFESNSYERNRSKNNMYKYLLLYTYYTSVSYTHLDVYKRQSLL